MHLADQAHHLLARQKLDWDLLAGNYRDLAAVETNTFQFDGFVIRVQYNPARIISSSAGVDAATIRARPCFLCRQNRPPQQRELALGDDLLLLCNPYPIFPEHFTIPTLSHDGQRIAGNLELMLELAQQLHPRYLVFYNGPRCGASAPDHLHFQAGTRGFLPIESDVDAVEKAQLVDRSSLRVWAIERYLRRVLVIESQCRPALLEAFDMVTRLLQQATQQADEPMMNLLALYDASGKWRVIVFPRARHRPSFYEAAGEARILLSPAAVDLGGVCITPLRHDFERINRDLLIQMFDEVTLAAGPFESWTSEIGASL